MHRRLASVLAALTVFIVPAAASAQPAPPPASAAGPAAYAPFAPMIGKTWRGVATAQPGVEDVQRWEWAVGGHAVRVVHSVNAGAYAGETLIFRDRDSGDYVFHYFTTGGFHTTGVMTPVAGGFEVDETVHGAETIERLKSTAMLGTDGVYRVRSSSEQDGGWVEIGGFDYREDPSASVVLPAVQTAMEAPASVGPLELTRRIVRGVDEPQDVAGYLRVRNGSPVADRLVGVACTCADRVELHRIQREGPNPGMAKDEAWLVPGAGQLDVRPGSDLHFMLINYDPARASDGTVRLRLEFAEAGAVEADFILVDDSRAAWERFEP
ncbi:hypothetical protein GCM10009116_08490 [Brevundimonas basaltis]|uniref:Copper(I)-binding protein n=1 Tax=Brevundimonas basaltis TaxID=472166 RepID=A0A7W8HYW5_9CAUL|nr:copper chaperone PCu(A)C [Brevundimonas basaltis]MBB5292224.1 copper(I)-binding protein [Brevundimonas basaltis]